MLDTPLVRAVLAAVSGTVFLVVLLAAALAPRPASRATLPLAPKIALRAEALRVPVRSAELGR